MKLLSFGSYDEYKQAQVTGNRLKFHNVYAEDPELERIAAHYSARCKGPGRGLCHGVRNGYEVRRLRKLLPAVDIIGTDIADSVSRVPNCIVWDMHEVKPEWMGAIDFMYSNSWDHTYDPPMLFRRWSECLSAEGRLYLPYTELQSERGVTESTKIDVFGCSLNELLDLVRQSCDIEDLLEVEPRFTSQIVRRRLAHLRAGEFHKAITARVTSRRVVVLVLRRKRRFDG